MVWRPRAQDAVMVGRGGGRLGAEPRVRGVDHHPAGVVFQQVEAAGPRGGESDTRRERIGRDASGAGEVVPVPSGSNPDVPPLPFLSRARVLCRPGRTARLLYRLP